MARNIDKYALDSPRSHPRSDGTGGENGEGPLWRRVDGLFQKGFPAPPAKPDSKYPDPVYYLPYTPELDTESDDRITPPKANPEYLATAYVVDVGRQAMGISTMVPWDLRHVPVSRADFDSSIENSIIPNKYNSHQNGGLRWARKYFVLVMRVDGDRNPEPAVLMLGAQQMHDLCTQLATHRKYVKDLTGVPLTIVSVNGSVSVDADPDETRLDMSLLKSRDEDGTLVLNKYLFTVREEYEKFLLEHGWQCEVTEEGERYAWRLTGVAAPADEEEIDDSGPAPWDVQAPLATTKVTETDADEFEDYSKQQLQEIIDAAGIELPARATRQAMIDAIIAARS